MSDAMAKQKEAEVSQQKTEEQQKQEDQQKRLMIVTIAVDPVTFETALIPNANVKTQGHMTAVLEAGVKQNEANVSARIFGSIIGKVLESKQGKKLFGLGK